MRSSGSRGPLQEQKITPASRSAAYTGLVPPAGVAKLHDVAPRRVNRKHPIRSPRMSAIRQERRFWNFAPKLLPSAQKTAAGRSAIQNRLKMSRAKCCDASAIESNRASSVWTRSLRNFCVTKAEKFFSPRTCCRGQTAEARRNTMDNHLLWRRTTFSHKSC